MFIISIMSPCYTQYEYLQVNGGCTGRLATSPPNCPLYQALCVTRTANLRQKSDPTRCLKHSKQDMMLPKACFTRRHSRTLNSNTWRNNFYWRSIWCDRLNTHYHICDKIYSIYKNERHMFFSNSSMTTLHHSIGNIISLNSQTMKWLLEVF